MIQKALALVIAESARMNVKLKARVNPSDAQTIRQALDQLAAKGDEFIFKAEMEGASAKELLFSFEKSGEEIDATSRATSKLGS